MRVRPSFKKFASLAGNLRLMPGQPPRRCNATHNHHRSLPGENSPITPGFPKGPAIC
jgi:hypothetical protein